MNKLLCVFIMMLILGACEKANYYYLILDNGSGLTKWSEVYTNGVKIGEISAFGLQSDGRVWCELKIDADVKMTQSATFFLKPTSMLGSGRAIIVDLPADNNVYLPNDTIDQSAIIIEPLPMTWEPDSLQRQKVEAVGDIIVKALDEIVETLASDTTKLNSITRSNE